ncbi:hypothetical protein DVH24_011549 [Malus domestica]|uniref:Uncharacterized protein n=1 Tax=Malus domestica TaxID=3750 RepID=A0A498JZU6_MALDO|nr:hypothetical protein DVH24_011549 [Malus domestica]
MHSPRHCKSLFFLTMRYLGSMPSTIFNMSSLQAIDLPNSSLSDELPAPGNIFSQLPNLYAKSQPVYSVAPNSNCYLYPIVTSPEAYLPAFQILPCLPSYIRAITA